MTRDTLTTSCYHSVIPKLHVRIINQNESVTGPRRIGIESRPENWEFSPQLLGLMRHKIE